MTILSVQNLNVRHGLLQAVRDVSFDLATGDVLALVGANGAGKTTLLRSLAGAHLPASGRITLNGDDMTAVPSHQRIARGIALVPEGRRLFSQMTVEENLLLGKSSGRTGNGPSIVFSMPSPTSSPVAMPRPAISPVANNRQRRSAGR